MDNKEMLIRNQTDVALKDWREKEKKALELLRIVGDLRFDKSIELSLFRQSIYDARPSEVLNDHLFAKNYVKQPISIDHTLQLALAIQQLESLQPAKIDLGKLAAEWLDTGKTDNADAFVADRLGDLVTTGEITPLEPKDVVLYGFGRIGRLAARRIIEQTGKGEQLRLKAIVLRPKLKDLREESLKRAALLSKDTVHGKFRGIIKVSEDGKELIINGNKVQMIYAGSPDDIDYTTYGIKNALVIDNTGVWRDKEALSQHLRPGIDQVMLTAPGKGIPNIVFGVNQNDLNLAQDKVFCAASCTTNAIVPIIKTIDDQYGIEKGHIETIHAYTSDQNLLDNFHKKPRRGRGAATNMVLTTTGAAVAVAKVLPKLAGKLTGNSVRVPTPNVSLVIINLTIKEATNVENVNNLLREAALHGDLVEQLHYSTSTEYVSSQAVGMTSTSVIDAPSTIISEDGKSVTLYAWYDNEFGYTCQVIRLAKHVAKVRRGVYY